MTKFGRDSSMPLSGPAVSHSQATAFIQGWAAILSDQNGCLIPLGATQDEASIGNAHRRRLSAYGRMVFRCALSFAAPGQNTGLVFCSQHGDTTLTLELLQAGLAEELMSPTGFSLSVHNATAGLLDIARRSQVGHVAIAAGSQTLAAGILEAQVRLNERPDLPQLLLYIDVPLAAGYPPNEESSGINVLAIRLTAARATDSIGQLDRYNAEQSLDSTLSSQQLTMSLVECLKDRNRSPDRWTSQGSSWEISTY